MFTNALITIINDIHHQNVMLVVPNHIVNLFNYNIEFTHCFLTYR